MQQYSIFDQTNFLKLASWYNKSLKKNSRHRGKLKFFQINVKRRSTSENNVSSHQPWVTDCNIFFFFFCSIYFSITNLVRRYRVREKNRETIPTKFRNLQTSAETVTAVTTSRKGKLASWNDRDFYNMNPRFESYSYSPKNVFLW